VAPAGASAAEPVVVPLFAPGTNAMPAHLRPAGANDAPGGGWAVVEDGTAAGLRVLAQLGGPTVAGHTRLAVSDQPALARLRADVRLNLVGGAADRAAGLALRLAEAETYYAAEVDTRRFMVTLSRVQGGVRTVLAEVAAGVETGRWYRLGLAAAGDRLGVWLDDTQVIAATDATLPGPGRVALLTRGESVAVFDDFVIYPME
jgi:hypothetical protein